MPAATSSRDTVDWPSLHRRAEDLARRAYVPYSHYPVGAAGLVDDGRVVAGCNVENAGYGVTLCAECGLVSELVAGGGGRLVAFCCVNERGETIMPCGRCRQLLWEHGGPEMLIDTPLGVTTMAEVLPQAFGAPDLAHVSASRVEGFRPREQFDPAAARGASAGTARADVTRTDVMGGQR